MHLETARMIVGKRSFSTDWFPAKTGIAPVLAGNFIAVKVYC